MIYRNLPKSTDLFLWPSTSLSNGSRPPYSQIWQKYKWLTLSELSSVSTVTPVHHNRQCQEPQQWYYGRFMGIIQNSSTDPTDSRWMGQWRQQTRILRNFVKDDRNLLDLAWEAIVFYSPIELLSFLPPWWRHFSWSMVWRQSCQLKWKFLHFESWWKHSLKKLNGHVPSLINWTLSRRRR